MDLGIAHEPGNPNYKHPIVQHATGILTRAKERIHTTPCQPGRQIGIISCTF